MKRRAGKFSKQLARLSSAGIDHLDLESGRHGNDSKWALEDRRQVKTKLSGDTLKDRQKITSRIKKIDNRLSKWAQEHIGNGSGKLVKFSGWEQRLNPRMPFQQEILHNPVSDAVRKLVRPTPEAAQATAQVTSQAPLNAPAATPGGTPFGAEIEPFEGTVGQQVMAVVFETAPLIAPALLVVMPLLCAQEEDLMPIGESAPSQSQGPLPIPTSQLEEQRGQLPQKDKSAKPSQEEATLEAPGTGDIAGGEDGPIIQTAATPGTQPGGPTSLVSTLMTLMSDDEDEQPKLKTVDFEPPPLS